MRHWQRHNHAGDLGRQPLLLIRKQDTTLHQSLVQEHLHVLVDESAEHLLLDICGTVSVALARDQSLEPHRVDLGKNFLFALLASYRCLSLLFLSWGRCRAASSLLLSLLLGSIDFGQQGKNAQQKLSLLRAEIVLDRVEHLCSLLGMLILQVPHELFLINLLHLVSLSQLLPLELVGHDFEFVPEQLFRHIEASFLCRLQSLETYVAEAQKLLTTLTLTLHHSSLHEFKTLDITKFAEERF